MTARTKALLTTVGAAVPAFLLGPIIWPVADIGVQPTAAQLPAFLLLAVGDALLFGAGVTFVAFGLPLVRRVAPGSRVRAWVMYVSVSYLMVSWWPHLNMHNANGFDLGGLLLIDYLFHLPLEIAAVALAVCCFSLYGPRQRTTRAPGAAQADARPLAGSRA